MGVRPLILATVHGFFIHGRTALGHSLWHFTPQVKTTQAWLVLCHLSLHGVTSMTFLMAVHQMWTQMHFSSFKLQWPMQQQPLPIFQVLTEITFLPSVEYLEYSHSLQESKQSAAYEESCCWIPLEAMGKDVQSYMRQIYLPRTHVRTPIADTDPNNRFVS